MSPPPKSLTPMPMSVLDLPDAELTTLGPDHATTKTEDGQVKSPLLPLVEEHDGKRSTLQEPVVSEEETPTPMSPLPMTLPMTLSMPHAMTEHSATPIRPRRSMLSEASATRPQATSSTTDLDGVDTANVHECRICFDQVETLQAHMCLGCGGWFCMNCMRWYLEYKITEGEVSPKKMICPSPQCKRPLAEDLIEGIVPPELFAKYLEFLANQRAGIRFCPRPGCCALLEEPLFTMTRRAKCTHCEQESCMRCGELYHSAPLCRRVERRYGHWKKRHDVRACPRCQADIEKQGGCSHMKCFQCDQEFCWSCLRPWDAHDETLCVALAFVHSKNPKYGCYTPMRVVTKGVVVTAAAVVVVAGAGLAVVAVPSYLLFKWAKRSVYRHRHRAKRSTHATGSNRHSELFILE